METRDFWCFTSNLLIQQYATIFITPPLIYPFRLLPLEARVVIKRCTADKELGKRAGDPDPWRGASDKETRNRLPDRPVVLLAMESADLRSKHKRVRFATARLTYLVCRFTLPACLPVSRAHGDEPIGV